MKGTAIPWIALGLVLGSCSVVLADGEGTAQIEPGPTAVAATIGTWTVTYHPGPGGLAPGGGLRLQLSGYPIRLFETPQTGDPVSRAYTTARCTDSKVPVQVRFEQQLKAGWQSIEELVVTVGAPGLSPQAALVITYGDKSGGGPGGQIRGAEGEGLPVRMSSDTDGDGTFAPLDEYPRLTLVGGVASRLTVNAPSQAVVGRPVRVIVEASDARNQLASQNLPPVRLTGPGLAAPVVARFSEGQRGALPVEVVFSKPGVQRLSVQPLLSEGSAEPTTLKELVSGKVTPSEADPGFRPELVRVQIDAVAVRPGSSIRLLSTWRNAGEAAATRDYRMSCHLERRPAAGRAVVNWDHEPAVPTKAWTPGTEITDEHTCGFPPEVPAGEYMLTLGLYVAPQPGQFDVVASYEVCRIRVGPEEPFLRSFPAGESNPIEVLAEDPPYRLLWGDTHCHTEHSGDGSGTVTGLYEYARDVSGLEFCACADHVGPSFPQKEWAQIQQAAKAYNEPGRFVSILGYELSNMEHGDKNVYYLRDDEPIRAARSGEAEDLYRMLQGVDCIVIPHHPAYPIGLRGTDWTRIDPLLTPVVEMCSQHGAGEVLGGPRPYGSNKPMGPSLPGGFAQDALDRGLRLGFMCSSDDHSGHAGKAGFLAAVYAKTFDREGIFEALRARRCYGTTGAHLLLNFTANDQPMGSLLDTPVPPRLSVEVHGTAKLEAVEVVRDGKVCRSETPTGRDCEFSFVPAALDRPESYFYVRVRQSDGQLAWSSPVFVHNTGPLPHLEISKVMPGTPGLVAGTRSTVQATVTNTGQVRSEAATGEVLLDGPAARVTVREKPPLPSGIGGLLARPGLQVWRWKVDDETVNVFVRWGGGEDARDCEGELRVVDAGAYYMTGFHLESDDVVEDLGNGRIRWKTFAEAGTGDGLNLWVKIDPRKPTRLQLSATRGGQARPEEIVTGDGKATRLPVSLSLVEYDPNRWIGEVLVPALPPGATQTITVPWTPTAPGQGTLLCRLMNAQGKQEASASVPVRVAAGPSANP
jgi:hypothetical protein